MPAAAPKPAREAVFFILAHAVGEPPSCTAACKRQPQARIDAWTGLQRTQRDGTTFVFCSHALHRSNKTAPARPQRPPQRPARAESITAPLCAACGPSWRAYEASPPAACGTTDRARAPAHRLRCNQDADPDRGRERHQRGRARGYIALAWSCWRSSTSAKRRPTFCIRTQFVPNRAKAKRPIRENRPKCLNSWWGH